MKIFPWEFDSFVRNSVLAVRIDHPIDTRKLLEEFLLVADAEKTIVHPDIYHNGGWHGIPLHSKSGGAVVQFSGGEGEYEWGESTKLAPYTRELCESIGSGLARVRYLTLNPGYKVFWHVDDNESFGQEYLRFHVPVITNPRAKMWIANKVFHVSDGLWTFDFGFPHRLRNDGSASRTHLVFDVKADTLAISKEQISLINDIARSNISEKKKCKEMYERLFLRFVMIKFYYLVLKAKIRKLRR